MEQATDISALVKHGDELLVDGQITEAAAEYSRALERDPNAVDAHLGIAKAYLALGSYGYVYMACQRVTQLAPDSADAAIARAILLVVEQRHDAALTELEQAERLAPGQPYVHALRGYCYRRLGNGFDALSAESKAARLSGHRGWDHLFPKVQPAAAIASAPPAVGAPWQAGTAGAPPLPPMPPRPLPPMPSAPPSTRDDQPASPRPWDQRPGYERTMVRARWATRGRPVVTLTLIAINVLVYLACAALSQSLLYPAPDRSIPNSLALANPLYIYGESAGILIQQDPLQAYRLVTAMFLHANFIHIGLNMWSLYVVGTVVERVFGARRYLIIYFGSGLIAGIAQAWLSPTIPAIGASGAIFGIFGAFGAFIWMRRRALGPAASAMIGQWILVVAINLVFSVVDPQIALYDHVGGLVSGLILGAIFVGTSRPRRSAPV
jgi:membrane associated rhomboid family serine protease